MLAQPFMREHRFELGEFYALLMFATAGGMLIPGSGERLVIFIGIETMSLAVYVLTGCSAARRRSRRKAPWYFITGAFATAILLYGMARWPRHDRRRRSGNRRQHAGRRRRRCSSSACC